MRSSLKQLNQNYDENKEEGEDPFLRTAPTILIIHAKNKTQMSPVDAGIAGYHVVLACQTLGIGTVWNGFHQVFCGLFGKLKKLSLIPKGHKVLSTICMGYPKFKYKRQVHRKTLDIAYKT